MSLNKPFTARHLAAWSVGIALAQFVVFSVVFMATGKIEDAVFAAVVAAVFIAFAAVATTVVVPSVAAFAAAFAAAVAAAVVAAFVAPAVMFGAVSGVFVAVAASAAHQNGAKGNFGTLFYIAIPLGIAGAVFAFAKTGSWWLGMIILLIDIFGKMIIARRAEREKPDIVTTVLGV